MTMTRRQFLITTMTATAAAMAWEPLKLPGVTDAPLYEVHVELMDSFTSRITPEIFQGKTVSDNLVLFALPKEYQLPDPHLDARVDDTSDRYQVSVTSQNAALWVWLGLDNADANYSDNFFHLMPGASRKILVQPWSKLSRADFVNQLRVRRLFDTHSLV